MMPAPKTTKSRPPLTGATLPALPPLRVRFRSEITFDQAVARLEHLFFMHWSLVRATAGTLIRIPEIEAKIFLAHSLYLHAEIAAAMRRRLIELRVRDTRLLAVPVNISVLCDELLHATSSAEFISGYGVIVDELKLRHTDYLEKADDLLDRPSVTMLSRFAPDFQQIAAWLTAARIAYLAVEPSSDRFGAHIASILSSQSSGSDLPALRQASGPYHRSNECARDGRFALFHQSRSYSAEDASVSTPDGAYSIDRLELARVQRDEIDAIETFANVLFDLGEAPFDLVQQLARFVEDEARHAEAGHAMLASLGYDPFELPCSIIGINVRAPMPPVLAFAQINIFGELNIVSRLNVLAQQAYARGDDVVGKAFDFIHADELTHVRRGRKILREMAPTQDLAEVEDKARRFAAKRLAEEGVLGEDYALSLSRKQIGELLGE